VVVRSALVAADPRYRFRVLGPFEVSVDGVVRDLGGRKPAELLAVLVLRSNEVVSTDRLVEELWGDEPPRTARKTLQVHVSRLRRELGDDTVETRPTGYVVVVMPGQVDAQQFEELVEQGRDELRGGRCVEAASLLRQALALWRGPVLAGMEVDGSTRGIAARLEDLRLVAVESRIEADLALGRHASLVGELEGLVVEHPYREGLRRQLMLALYRSGRQADALAAYRAARVSLVEELGVEPGPELRELEAAMLRHDPTLAPPQTGAAVSSRASSRRALIAGGLCLALIAAVLAGALAWRSTASEWSPPQVVADSLVRIDPATNSVVAVTKIGREPDRLAVGAGAVWVVNHRDRTVTRVRPNGTLDTIGGIVFADHVAVDGDDVWVSSFDRASIARIDGRTGEVVESVGIPARHAEGLTVGGGYLWVTNPATERGVGTETVSAIDLRTRTVAATIRVGTTPIFTTFGDGAVWVSNYDADTISIVRPGSAEAETIDACDGPLGIATGFHSVWVVCYWSSELVRIDARTLQAVAHVALGPGPLDVSTGAGAVWATSRESNEVARIDPRTNRVTERIRWEGAGAPQSVVATDDAVWVSVNSCARPPCS
jgi:DNA-binding SARP family transcriptional activator/streptogramin lyase